MKKIIIAGLLGVLFFIFLLFLYLEATKEPPEVIIRRDSPGALENILTIVLCVLFPFYCIYSFMVAARIVGIHAPSFRKCAVIAWPISIWGIISVIYAIAFSFIPFIGEFLSFFVLLTATAYETKKAFHADWSRVIIACGLFAFLWFLLPPIYLVKEYLLKKYG